MSFSSTHSEILKLNGYDLRDLGGTASFEASAISGRGLAPTRERELQFPGQMGSRDYGSYYGNRRIEISGTLYADNIHDFRVGLNKIKELCRLRTFVDGVLYEQVEAQMLWFADESVIAGPYTISNYGSGAGYYWLTCKDAQYNLPSAYPSDNDMAGLTVSFANRGATGVGEYEIFENVVATGQFFLTKNHTGISLGDTMWMTDNRYYLVNYSGTMNEEHMTAQWFKTGYSRLTLPFKAVYPFAVSDPKQVDFTPDIVNGYFKAINTGNAISYPVYKIKGAADTPQIVEATHSLVWNANNNDASNILGESVTADISAGGFYGQTGKLDQAIAFDTNLDQTEGDSANITTVSTREGMGIGTGLDVNQGTLSLWIKKPGNWTTLPGPDLAPGGGFHYEYLYNNDSAPDVFRLYHFVSSPTAPADPDLNYLTFEVGGEGSSMDASLLEAGKWYFVICRWDCRRAGFSTEFASYESEIEVYSDAGARVGYSGGTGIDVPTAIGATSYLANTAALAHFNGLIDDLAIWDRPLTDTERSTLVNSGTGVRADTVASSELVYYSDFDQTVGTVFDDEQIASSNMDTLQSAVVTVESATVAAYGDVIFKDEDRIVVYDETGYKVDGMSHSMNDATTVYLQDSGGAGSVLYDADKVGVYATLNGTNQYFQTASNPGGLLWPADDGAGAGNMSFSFWVKTETPGASIDTILYKSGTSGLYGLVHLVYVNSSGNIYGALYDTSGGPYDAVVSTTVVTDGKWHHVAITYEDAATPEYILYIDGVAEYTSNTVTGTRNYDTGTAGIATIGSYYGGGSYFEGSLRDVAFWSGDVLTDTEVLTLATNPLGADSVGTVTSWWKLNESSLAAPVDSGAQSNTLINNGTVTRTQLAYISKNLIADGGFENGGIANWHDGGGGGGTGYYLAKSTSTVRKDAHSLYLNYGSSYLTATSADFNIGNSESYVYRLWGYPDATADTQLLVKDVASGTWLTNTNFSHTNSTWNFFESCFQTAASGTTTGNFNIASGSGNSYWDDLKLLPNLVDNGGMEGVYGGSGNAPNWTIYNAGAATFSSDAGAHSGSLCQEMVLPDASAIYQPNRTVVQNNWYELSFWYKVASGTPSLWVQAGSNWYGGVAEYLSKAFPATTDWQRGSHVFKASTGTRLDVAFRASNYGYTFLVDDVSVVHRPDLSVSFNNMTNGYRFEPTRLTRGYKAGLNEEAYFDDVIISPSEYAGRMVVRPQFPSDTGELYPFLLRLYEDTDNFLEVYYLGTSDKFVVAKKVSGTWLAAYSPVMSFAQDEEIEIGWSFDSTNGLKVFVNGSNTGATNQASTTTWTVALAPSTAYIGFNGATYPNDYIIDDLEILAKSQPAEWFAEQHAKRNAAKNLNLPFKYSATLNAGDILTGTALDHKVRGRVEMYHASSGATSNGMGVANVGGSLMPILSPTKSMLYFPNSIPSGVEIYYRENHQ